MPAVVDYGYRTRNDPAIDELDPYGGMLGNGAVNNEITEEALIHYLDNPVDWIEDLLNAHPETYQADIINTLNKDRFVSVKSGKGVGKTALEAWTLLWFLCTHPFCRVIATAPSKTQLIDVLWAEVHKWVTQSGKLQQIVTATADRVVVKSAPQSWFAAARTAEVRKLGKSGLMVAEALQGRHSQSGTLFLVDEASGIDEAIMNTIDGILTDPDAYILMAGNPLRPQGRFYDSFHTQRHLWKTFTVNSEDSPRVQKTYCERMLEICGSRDHPKYLAEVRGEFPPALHNTLFPLDLIERSQQLVLKANEFDTYELGVDVARYGGDATCICVKHGPVIERIDAYNDMNTMEVCGRVVQYISKYRPTRVKVDIIGLGAGVYDRLRELGYKEVIGVAGSAACSTKEASDQYANMRAETHFYLRTLLEQGRLKLPKDDHLIAEMTSLTFKYSSRGKCQVESKEELRDRGVKSPDRLDSLVLACFPAQTMVQSRARFGNIAIMGR